VAPDEVGAEVGEGTPHVGEQVADDPPTGRRWNEDDCQEPARSSTADCHVVRVDSHRQPSDVLAGERDRIRRHDQEAAGNLNRARILTDLGAETDFGRWPRELSEETGEQGNRDLPAQKGPIVRRDRHLPGDYDPAPHKGEMV
jgi:hypothetical protein